MFQNLMYAIKRRVLDEVEDTFNKHAVFSGKVKTYHKFPFKERPQYGVLLKNTSAAQTRLSPDNFMGDLVTHVRLATIQDMPGESIEWVREDSRNITEYIQDEDVSFQLGPTQRMFFTANKPIVSGINNTVYADNFRQVDIKIDGITVFPEYVNGEKGLVLLSRAPGPGSVVTISYFCMRLATPGYYSVIFTSETSFDVLPMYRSDEEVIERTTGLETSVSLAHDKVLNNSEMISMKGVNGGQSFELTKGTDYSIDNTNGILTFLVPLPPNYKLSATYTYGDGASIGTRTFHDYQEISDIIPGVVISIGRRARTGDQQMIIISKYRQTNARIYGGHWQMALNLSVISKDPMQLEEMTDHLISDFWGNKKNRLEFEGITMNSIEPTGESEEIFADVTGDVYYTNSVDINIQTEWQKFVPYKATIERFNVSPHLYPTLHNFSVDKNNGMVQLEIIPSSSLVVKYPVIGYEKVT